ncbi:hypothetical protein V2J09_009837 [Rumex salicifolius]
MTILSEAVTSKSGHLKRQLKEVSELTLSPPLKVTVGAFKLFTQFCYQCDVVLTPFNLAGDFRDGTGDSLQRKAESYFCRAVAVNCDLSASVFLSSLSLMPEAEDLVFLPSRCLEALSSMDDSHDGVSGCADCLKAVPPVQFQIIVDSMQRRLNRSHDFLYGIIDLYLKVYDGNISEERKTQICSSIDCSMLSPQILMQSVQNPRMPLRFIVQAMLMEQLNTHRSVSNAITSSRLTHHDQINYQVVDNEILPSEANTLSVFLQRDAALQQVAQLKAAIDTTTSRIQSLENELTNMRLRLNESKKDVSNIKEENFCGRSVSCRFSTKTVNKVERGERGSISSSNLRFKVLPPSDQGELVQERSSSSNENGYPKTKKNIIQWFIKGLKSALRVPLSGSKKGQCKVESSNGDKGVMAGEQHALVSLTCKDENSEHQGGSDMIDREGLVVIS